MQFRNYGYFNVSFFFELQGDNGEPGPMGPLTIREGKVLNIVMCKSTRAYIISVVWLHGSTKTRLNRANTRLHVATCSLFGVSDMTFHMIIISLFHN